MKKRNIIAMLMAPLIMLVLPGCIRLWQENLDIRTYLLQADRTGPALEAPLAGKLWIEPVHVLPPFNVRNLVLRLNDVEFAASYYTELMMSPSDNFRSCFYRWLDGSGIFADSSVADRSGMTHSLIVSVLEFYGDKAESAAVLCIKVALMDESGRTDRLLMSKEYRRTQPADDLSAESLLRAYNMALADILSDAETDIAAALH